MRLQSGLSIGLFLVAFGVTRAAEAQESYAVPEGGWLYAYEANAGEDIAGAADSGFTSLDGTFSHDNGSDEWDGSTLGAGNGVPGGVAVVDGSYVRIQDAGDPRDHGFADPGSNRKVYLLHDLSADGATETQLDEGVTLYFRARLSPEGEDLHLGGGEVLPFPTGGDGYALHDGGKGSIGIKQASGGVVSFVLASDAETGGLGTAIMTNNLNGTEISGDVDTGDPGDPLALALDVGEWHEYWITLHRPAEGGAGTHRLSVWIDGTLEADAADIDLTAGSGSDADGITYVAIGQGSTGQSGAIDIDYVRVAAGVHAPQPGGGGVAVPVLPAWALLALVAALGLAGAVHATRRRPEAA